MKKGQDATTQMLWGILGCGATDENDALAMVGQALDGRLEPLTSSEERKGLYKEILKRLKHVTPERTVLREDDLLGAAVCFGLVVLTTIPAIVPFLVFYDRFVALRVSNLLLLVVMFLIGYLWARATHTNAWLFGSALLLAGLVLVAIAMALGG